MKYRFIIVNIFCFVLFNWFTFPVLALELKANVYNEIGIESLNYSSYLNPSNLYSYKEFQYFLKYDLVIKNNLGEGARGAIKLEGQYIPVSYAEDTNNTDKTFIKELYMDFLADDFSFRIGKQFVKWGNSFFNPIDILNLKNNPLKPISDEEGNPFINLTFPFNDSYSLDLLSVVKPGEINSIKDLPLISRIAFSQDKLSGFIFFEVQSEQKPMYGLNVEYVFPLKKEMDVSIYGEASLKYESQRSRIIDSEGTFQIEELNKDNYTAFVLGGRFKWNFLSAHALDGMGFTIEYYYNDENWDANDFKVYLNYLNSIKNDPVHYSNMLLYTNRFKNSKDYLYTSLSFEGLFDNDLYINADAVFNLADSSYIFMPNIAYLLNNTNTVLGVKAIFFCGNAESEFGNSIANHQIIFYSQVSF